jgi:hypothetical protein
MWGFFLSAASASPRKNSKDNCQTKLLHRSDLMPPAERYFASANLWALIQQRLRVPGIDFKFSSFYGKG